MEQIRSVIAVCLLLLSTGTAVRAAQLTGTTYDASAATLSDVLVKLSCLSGIQFEDSTYSDSNGGFAFHDFPIGNYSLEFQISGYIMKDTICLLGKTSANISITLLKTPHGTRHIGTLIRDEVWLPSGNPHILTGDISITGSLFIAPGCSVFSEGSSKYSIRINPRNNGLLTIGRNGAASVVLLCNILANDSTTTL